jgi:hypothetical protein
MERAAEAAALCAFQDNWQLIADAQTSVRGGDAGCEDDGNGSYAFRMEALVWVIR